ncbi:MAG: secretion system protein E [Ruminiclostridium sp.]|nr:secretion system protein E [Ruminiclostridium sp.]
MLKEIDKYSVDEPHASISINYDNDQGSYLYKVEEEELTEFERALLEQVYEEMTSLLTLHDLPEEKDKSDFLRKKISEIANSFGISFESKSLEKILYYIKRNVVGYGKMNPLMMDPNIEDISCNGYNVPIYIYHRKYQQNIKTNIFFDENELDTFVLVMAERSGKMLSRAAPMINSTLPDGSRLQATYSSEISTRGSSFTIRKFREEPFTPVDLIDYKTFSNNMLAYLWLCMENRKNLIFAGGTASGKTSALNAISLFMPPAAKIVSIEDTRELRLPHDNWLPSVTRMSEMSKEGEIDMYELLRQAMRQRPEYIIVGEIRGKEAQTLFQAMSTGHTTYSTMHATDVEEVISRLQNEPMNIPLMMFHALDIICIQVLTYTADGKRVRRNKVIAEVQEVDPVSRSIKVVDVFKWDPVLDEFKGTGESVILRRIMTQRGWDEEKLHTELNQRSLILEYMIKNNIKNYQDVFSLVQGYFTNPGTVLKKIRGSNLSIRK